MNPMSTLISCHANHGHENDQVLACFDPKLQQPALAPVQREISRPQVRPLAITGQSYDQLEHCNGACDRLEYLHDELKAAPLP